MSYEASLEFPVGAESLFNRLVDPEVVVARFDQAGDTDIEIEQCEADGDDFVVSWKRSAVADIPGFASRFIKPRNTLHQTDRWGPPAADGSRDGTFSGSAESVPIGLSGQMSITATGAGSCTYAIEGNFDVKLPIVGGRIARWAEGESAPRLEAELEFLHDTVSG